MEYKAVSVKNSEKLVVNVLIKHGKKRYKHQVQEGLKTTFERKNAPGKVTFTTFVDSDSKKRISNGDSVAIVVNGKNFFYGFVFFISPKTDKTLDVTVYDQLRYFKNKDTYISKKRTSTVLIKKIAKDFKLNCGKLANTKYPVSRIDDNATLFDIVQNSLDETLMARGKI